MLTETTMNTDLILRCAPVWNVGHNLAAYLAWSDNLRFAAEHESVGRAADVLKGFAYALSGTRTVRPSVTRFLTNATPEQLLPWIIKAAEAGLDPIGVVEMLNKEYR